jgi:rfaE bifunctional protein kinase chain/domain
MTRALTKNLKEIDPGHWDHARLKQLLGLIRGKRILVVGDVGVDRYTLGLVERISPEAPVPIVLVEEEKLKLGLAANVADNVQALGGVPLLTGVVGVDRAGDDLKALLKANRIPHQHLIVDRGRRTVLKERIVSERQQLLRVDYETLKPVSQKIEAEILARIKTLLPKADAVILQDYAKGLISHRLAARIFIEARGAGKAVAVDPNSKTPPAVYRGATLLTPNSREAEALSGVLIRDEASLLEAGTRILSATEAKHVIVTRGKEGMAIFSSGERSVRLIPTYAREVYDVSGAGDTVISVLTLALAAGASMIEAAVLGNLAAGVEVGKRGTATVTQDEIRLAMEFFRKVAR